MDRVDGEDTAEALTSALWKIEPEQPWETAAITLPKPRFGFDPVRCQNGRGTSAAPEEGKGLGFGLPLARSSPSLHLALFTVLNHSSSTLFHYNFFI